MRTAALERHDIVQRLTATGTVRPTSVVHVGALVSGIIASTTVRSGDRVAAGEVIATIEDSAYRLQLHRAEAVLRGARLRLDEARRTHGRQEALQGQGFVSDAAVDSARELEQVAGEDAAAAEADVEAAKISLARCRIASPIAGTVLSKDIEVGQSVAAAFQVPDLFTIVSRLDRLEVVAMFAEADLAEVAPGATATLTVSAYPDETFRATVTSVLNTPETRQGIVDFPVLLAMDNPSGLIRPGMTAYVELRSLRRRDVETVPNQAVEFARARDRAASAPAEGPRHLYAMRGGQLVALAVRYGMSDDSRTEVIPIDRLADGERVVLKEAK
jgi:HlyD family secretion protein